MIRMAKLTEILQVEQIADAIGQLTVMELVDLVKSLEQKFGVSASYPLVVPTTTERRMEEIIDEQTEFTVILQSFGPNKLNVIKIVRALTGLGLKESKELVDTSPKPVKQGIGKHEADEIKRELEAVGATVIVE